MACYKKAISIDMNKGENGVVEAAEEVNLHDNRHAYETMQDAQDSDNDDDDKVLINGGLKYCGTLKKRRHYASLLFNLLLLLLCLAIGVLSYVVYALRNDIECIKNTARIQAADVAGMKTNFASTSNGLSDQIANLSKQLKDFPDTPAFTQLETSLLQVQNESTSTINTVGTLNDTLSKVNERGVVYYPVYNAKFMGFGYPTNRSFYQEYHAYTLDRCLQTLYQKSQADHAWNGLAFGHSQLDGWCICYKDSGILNRHSKHYLYYVLDD